jgi:hypothetical protein
MQQQMMDIINRLNSNQEKIEKTSFDTINQHDKVMNLVGQLVMDMDCMMTKLEAMNYSLEETVESISCDTEFETSQTLHCFSEMLEEQSGMIIELSQLLQIIMDEQQVESEVIHEMEAQIASNRETIEEAFQIHNI